MQKIVIGLVLIAIVLISGCAGPQSEQVTKQEQPTPGVSTPTGVSGATVDIKGFAFEPSTITVTNGTTVTWTNRDSVSHTITGDNFDSGSISQGNTCSQTFNDAGTFSYHCSIHPNMKGTVIVT